MIASLIIIALYSWLYRLGGSVNKLYRRLAIPLLTSLIYWLTNVNFWWLSFPIGLLAFSLPITLIGDDIHKDWRNWVWLPILGIIIGLMLLNLTLAIVFSLCFTTLVVLSNNKKTAEIFRWQFIEYFLGALIGYFVVMY